METKEILLDLRTKHGLSQDELAEKLFVTRQAVSRWENGETVPNTDTLKLLSGLYNVSINTLLGAPRKLICQCCGMPLEDDIIGRNADGTLNEDYCRWCYADGTYTYSDMDELIDVCVRNMANENFPAEQARDYLKQTLPSLDYWKRYDELSDGGQFESFKKQLIDEINDMHIEGMPKLETLNALPAAQRYVRPVSGRRDYVSGQSAGIGERGGALLRRAGEYGLYPDLHLRSRRSES